MTDRALPRPATFPRLPVGSTLAFMTATLLLAGAIHISVILLIPLVARSDGWSRLAAFAGQDRFIEIPVGGGGDLSVAGLDPLFVNGACRLRLDEAPAAITVGARGEFWSLALYDPQGTIIFSLNDRTAVDGRLDMIVANVAQNAELKKTGSPEIEQTIVVESQSNDLIALLRLFAPTAATRQEALGVLAAAECLPDPLEPRPSG